MSRSSWKHVTSVTVEQDAYHAAYWEAGHGTPILFLHGFMGRSECWQPLVSQLLDSHHLDSQRLVSQRLVSQRQEAQHLKSQRLPRLDSQLQAHYRCICLDMLGFGDSSKPMIRYDIATLVAFVRASLEALGIESCAIVGHSLGGWVASAYALAYPDAVTHLILAAPAGIRDDSFCGRYDHLRPLLWQIPVVDWALWLAQPIAKLSGQLEGLQQIRWIRRELNAQPAPRSFLLDRLRPEDAIDTVEKEIHQLQVPTLVITGDRDETIPLWHSETYANTVPNAQLAIIPDADHALPQRYATEMAKLIVPFVGSPDAAFSHPSS